MQDGKLFKINQQPMFVLIGWMLWVHIVLFCFFTGHGEATESLVSSLSQQKTSKSTVKENLTKYLQKIFRFTVGHWR